MIVLVVLEQVLPLARDGSMQWCEECWGAHLPAPCRCAAMYTLCANHVDAYTTNETTRLVQNTPATSNAAPRPVPLSDMDADDPCDRDDMDFDLIVSERPSRTRRLGLTRQSSGNAGQREEP